MTKRDKLLKRFMEKPRDFTWSELSSLLSQLGFQEYKPGKTGGSRRKFIHKDLQPIILHKPHPGKILKKYQVDLVIDKLKQDKLI